MSEISPHSSTVSPVPSVASGMPGLLDAGGASLRESIQSKDLDRNSKAGLS